MRTIWKYEIQPECEIEMPRGAEILTVQAQNDIPQLWGLVNPAAEKVKRSFHAYGTGHEVPDQPGRHIGTVQLEDGTLVFHIFETTDLKKE